MNMEDRLREAFEQEAELLHAPHGSPETAIRRGRRRRASNLIGGAALVLALVGGTAAGVQLLGDTDEPEEGNLASAVETDQTVDESIATDLQAAGIVDFVWEKVVLPKPTAGTDVWNIQIAGTDDGFVAVGSGYDPTTQGESLLVWRASNGTDWTLESTASPFDGPVDTLLNTGDGFVAIIRSFDDDSVESTSVYRSADGINWTRADIDLGSIGYNQYLWFTGAASGNGATVVAGVLQTEPDQPPVVFEEAGIVLQEGYEGFVVTDLGTGETITRLSNEAVYGGGGPIVYGPDGDVIVALSPEVVDGAFTEGSDGKVSVEQDGIRVDFNFNEGTYVATDISTGEVVIAGDESDLYQQPRIVIVHPDTDEVILDVSMDEFYRAQDDGWDNDGSSYRPESEIVILATTDETTWNRVELAAEAGEEVGVGGVSYGPDGFLLSTFSYGPDRAAQSVWRSADGQNWEQFSSTDGPGDGAIITAGDAYYRIGYSNRAAIARSTDGVDWTPVYEPASRGTYYNLLGAGDLGVVAVGHEQDDYIGPPLVIAQDGRTLVLDSETGRITVTEDATGEILTTIELDVYAVEAPAQIIEDAENGTIAITDIDGNVVMEFTEEEANAASEEAERDYEYSEPRTVIAFSYDGEEWFTATTVGLEVAWPQSMAVGDDAVAIIGQPIYDQPDSIERPIEPGEGSDGATVTTLVYGTEPYYGEGPDTHVWVGRPR